MTMLLGLVVTVTIFALAKSNSKRKTSSDKFPLAYIKQARIAIKLRANSTILLWPDFLVGLSWLFLAIQYFTNPTLDYISQLPSDVFCHLTLKTWVFKFTRFVSLRITLFCFSLFFDVGFPMGCLAFPIFSCYLFNRAYAFKR